MVGLPSLELPLDLGLTIVGFEATRSESQSNGGMAVTISASKAGWRRRCMHVGRFETWVASTRRGTQLRRRHSPYLSHNPNFSSPCEIHSHARKRRRIPQHNYLNSLTISVTHPGSSFQLLAE